MEKVTVLKTNLKKYINNFLNIFKKKENEKLIFIHIPKNAGSSMRRIIKDKLHNHINYVGHSAPLKYLQETNNFIILRDPISRFCSAFYYRINLLEECEMWANLNGIQSPSQFIQFLSNKNNKGKNNPIFSLRSEKQSIAGNSIYPICWVFQPQSAWIKNPNSILLQKNLDFEWNYFCKVKNIPYVSLPNSNQSKNSDDALKSLTYADISYLKRRYVDDFTIWEKFSNKHIAERIDLNFN